ncbi:hypothetical protein M6G53_04385 [Serratia nevei]|uniref:methyltransferase n=1 Tax=Serratia nevei TaxID=2703794 RepID=UPI00209CF4C4|nr:methyltransferase [Serratia nevei]MCP1104637.1 hypothetical protein [Serratia nevei]
MYENGENFSLKNLEGALRKNTPQVYGEQEVYETHEIDADKADRFTRAMHSLSIGSASLWPTRLSLSTHRVALDIGGASGTHAIGMMSHWPELTCIVFDLPEVCPLATDYAQRYGFSDRISTHGGNMWHDPYPTADLHLYSNVFHGWTADKNRFLAQKSYDSLPVGGRIVIHEALFDDGNDGPSTLAGYNLLMLGWTTQGRQYSGKDISDLLSDVGFDTPQVIPSLGYHSIVTAQKT